MNIDSLSEMMELDVCLQAESKHTIPKVERWERSRGLVEVVIMGVAKHFANKYVKS